MMNMAMETSRTCLDTILQLLEELKRKFLDHNVFGLIEPIYALKLDLTFIKMFFWGLSYWEEPEFDPHSPFFSTVSQLSAAANEFVADCEYLDHHHQFPNWEELCYDLKARIAEIKPRVQEISMGIFKCKPCQHNEWKSFLDYGKETASFIDFVQKCLIYLEEEEIEGEEMEFIQRKLGEFGIVSGFVAVKSFSELMFRHRTWVCQISCLACLYWIAGVDEREAVTMEDMVHELLPETLVITPGVVASCIEGRVIPQLLARYIDFLLRGLVTVIPLESDFEKLLESLIFLLSFLVHPPEEDLKNKEVVLARIYDVLIKKLQFLKADKLSSFLEMIDGIKVEVRDMYFMTPHSLYFNSPRTNAVGYLDSLLGTLKKLLEAEVDFVPLTKCLVEEVGLELSSLRPFLECYSDLQGELNHLWVRTLDVVYYAGYVINLCSAKVVPVWYCILGLPSVLKEIKFIKNQIDNQQICYMNASLGADQMKSSITNSNVEGDFTGFEEVVKLIMNDLLRGKDLTIISVSGMPGQGKTTLAKRLYNHPKVQHWFQTFVWIFVSKECTKRELLIKVASNVADMNSKKNDDIHNKTNDMSSRKKDDIHKKTDHELADLVRKSLKGRKYLIVMDDVWEVGLWNQVEESFPNDNVGSRILFTTRIHDLASQANPKSISRQLRLFSNEESWELMRKKLSHFHGSFLLEFSEIGKEIAIYCKGLPLAVSLIAAVLTRMKPDMEAWENLARDLKSRLAIEGCRDVIELSYENLPDHLKSCFLYTGAFPRGENILARKLKLLWIAEGFIKVDNEMIFSEELADGYLGNLVSQSLVVVTEKSSMGKIKKCNVHDLLYDFCLEKAKEERFLHWVEKSSVDDPSPRKFNHHRLCIGNCEPMPTLTRKELPTSQVHSLLWYYNDLARYFVIPYSFLKDFKVLTTLDCGGAFLEEDKACEVVEVVFSNIHLKHVALNLCGPLSLLNLLAITNLWNLQTLIVDVEDDLFKVISLPVSMWSMKSLRYVVVKYWRLSSEDCDQVCNSFAACCVETLGVIYIEEYDSKMDEFLAKFTRLRKLGVDLHGGSAIWLSMFKSLTRLESLRIEGRDMEHSTFSFPEIQNLKKLTLSCMEVPWCLISEVGKKLPNLEVLKLLWDACCGTSWDLKDDESFPNLRYLKLSDLDLEKMNFPSSDEDDDPIPFPCLEVLIVDSCRRLEEIPSGFGFIPTLNTIKVGRYCSHRAKLSAQRVLQEQRDEFGNQNLQVIVEHDVEVEEEDEEEEKVLHSGSFQSTISAPAFGSSGSFPSISKTSGFGSSTSSTQSPFGGTANSFQASGSLEFGAGGSFSMGSSGVGGDKSGRRKFKAKRMVKKMGSTAPSFNDQMQVFSQQLASLTMAEDNVNSSMPVLQEQRDLGNDSLQVIVEHDSDELEVEEEEEDEEEEEVLHEHDSDVQVEEEDEEEEENKSKKGVAEIYEEEHVQMSGLVSASLSFSDEQKKEVSSTPAFGSSGSFQTTNSASAFGSSTSSTQSPFGVQPGFGGTAPSFTSSVVNNDQMQVFSQQLASLTMTEDNVNSSMPVAPMFSQQPMPSPPGGYGFPAQSTNPFQFADVEVEEEDEEEEEVLHEHDSDDSAIAEPMRIKAKREKAKEERFLHWVEKRSVSGKGSITPNPEQESTFADQGSSTTSYSKEEGDHISQSSVVAEESALSLEEKNKQIEMSPTEMILASDIQEQNEILEHLHSDSEGSVIENIAQPNQTGILPSPGRVETEVERVPDAAETTRGLDFPFSVSLSVRGELSEQVDLKFESLYGFSSRNKPPENSEFKSCDFTSDADDYRILMRQKNREVKADHEKAIYIGWRLTSAPEEEKWRQASVMMLMDNAFTSLPSQPNSPNIVILFLQRNERLRKIPDSFFSLMCSVTFLDISGTRIRSLPSSLFGLYKLQVLRLRDSKCLDRLPEEIGLMKGLEVLDLFGTELYNMPDDVGNLSHLRQLLLSFYGNDDESENHDMSFFISPNIISRLRSLEELGISVYPEDKRWVSNVKFLINDLAKLNTLRCLDFYFPEVELLDRFTSTANAWENIRSKKFKFVVGKNVKRIVDRVPPEVEIKFNEHIRSLRFVNGEDVYEAVKKVAKYATALYLDHHLAIRSLSEMDITISKEMQFCTIRECPNLEKIIDDGKMVQPAYPRLEYLGMHYLWKLENIFGASLVKGSFGCLRSLVVDTCPMLEFILSESMVQCLWNLEELVVVNCTRVEEIIMKIDEEHVQTIEKKDTPVFPRLAKLQLQHLPQLHSFWWKLRGDSKDQLPNGSFTALHSAEVRSCPRLDLVSLESIKKDFSSRLEQTLQDGLLYRQVNSLIVAHLRDNNLNQAASAVASATMTPFNVEAPPNKLLELVAKGLAVEKDDALRGITSTALFDSNIHTGYGSLPAPRATSVDFSVMLDTKGSSKAFAKHETRHISEHKSVARCARFSPDGRFLATGSADTSIKLFEVSKVKQMMVPDTKDGHVRPVMRTFYDHLQPINDLDFHPQNPVLISGSEDHTIKFFDFSKASAKKAFRVIQDTHIVRSVSFHPSGDFLLAGTDHAIPHLYDVNTFQCYLSANLQDNGVNGAINQVRYSPTGAMYVTASKDGSIRLWDGVSANCARTVAGAHGTAEATSASFTKDQRYILSCGKDSSVKLWEIATGRLVKQYLGAVHTQMRCQAVFNDTEEFVLSIDEQDNEIVVWDALTAEKVNRWPSNHVGGLRWLDHSPTEAAFATCGTDRSIQFWKEIP